MKRRKSFDRYIGHLIYLRRSYNLMTQAEFAKKIGVTQGTLSKIEAGKISVRAFDFLKAAKVLDINIEIIQGEMK